MRPQNFPVLFSPSQKALPVKSTLRKYQPASLANQVKAGQQRKVLADQNYMYKCIDHIKVSFFKLSADHLMNFYRLKATVLVFS